MGLRFESNYQRFTGAAPLTLSDSDPLVRWYRIHEWNVDSGFEARLMGIMLNVETQFAPLGTVDFGWMRVDALLSNKYLTKFETKMIGATQSSKCNWTPRLVIIPIGDGITFSAGQGLATKAFSSVAGVYRYWSCYVTEANPV